MEISDCVIIPKEQLDRMERKLDQLLSRDNKPLSEYLTDDEVIKMLGIKKSTLYNWKSSGKIPFYKRPGSSISYYKHSEIIAFQSGFKHNSDAEIEIEAQSYIINKLNRKPVKYKKK